MLGFHRIAAARPKVTLADPKRCLESIKRLCDKADNAENTAILFPELALTGASCGDLFHSSTLLDAA